MYGGYGGEENADLEHCSGVKGMNEMGEQLTGAGHYVIHKNRSVRRRGHETVSSSSFKTLGRH